MWMSQVKIKPFFWIGHLALAGLVGIAPAPAGAQTPAAAGARTAKPAAPAVAPKAAPKPTTQYSATRARNRRAALARARAAALARELAEELPRLKADATGLLVPDLRAEAAIIYDPATNEVLWEENSQTQRSIASITKVMTATVFLENDPDLSQKVTIARSDVLRASTTFLRANDQVTTGDLLHLLLIASDNAASRALGRASPHGLPGFINRMNEKAAELGLEATHYADTSGLLSANVSSAFDMARLITHASNDERIGSVMRTSEYTVRTVNPKPRTITFRSTNRLLGREDLEVRAGKTGFISKAGYCLATLLRLPQSGHEVAVVVLGARSSAGRIMETRNLFEWLSAKTSALIGLASSPAAPAPQPLQ
jgi:D-alanyl-D-alanine endopeptidase (penicillin-binding protein 7)